MVIRFSCSPPQMAAAKKNCGKRYWLSLPPNRQFPLVMSKVAVIIPTYNRRDFVREAIASVLAQTYRDFELLVVDDGSNDNTGAAVQEFDDVRYVFQPNHGV